VIALAGLACAGASSRPRVVPQEYPPVPPDSVRVFHSDRELTDSGYRWTTLAVLSLLTQPEFVDVPRLERRLRAAAGELGANGVIIPDLSDLASPGGPMLVHPPGSLRAVAIRWSPARPAPR
jgi:hypothetical protein